MLAYLNKSTPTSMYVGSSSGFEKKKVLRIFMLFQSCVNKIHSNTTTKELPHT